MFAALLSQRRTEAHALLFERNFFEPERVVRM